MKKVILTVLTIGFVLGLDARTKIVRSGSTDGVHYNRVTESHSWFNHTLTCTNPGATICGWTNPHRVSGTNGSSVLVTTLEAWVNERIASGATSGEEYYGNTGILVVWTSSGNDRDIEITDAI